jgi:hypothetical protein
LEKGRGAVQKRTFKFLFLILNHWHCLDLPVNGDNKQQILVGLIIVLKFFADDMS